MAEEFRHVVYAHQQIFKEPEKFPLPPLKKRIIIKERKKEGNKKIARWEGTIISTTEELYIFELDSGVKECFRKNDFSSGQYIFLHP